MKTEDSYYMASLDSSESKAIVVHGLPMCVCVLCFLVPLFSSRETATQTHWQAMEHNCQRFRRIQWCHVIRHTHVISSRNLWNLWTLWNLRVFKSWNGFPMRIHVWKHTAVQRKALHSYRDSHSLFQKWVYTNKEGLSTYRGVLFKWKGRLSL